LSAPYFAYGTTQSGFLHHRALEPVLGAPVGRFRTVEPHGIVVPREAACSNPGCRFKHRMAALVRGHWSLHAEGDVFLVEDFGPLDALELSGPYTRETIEVVRGDGERLVAQAYPAAEPARWAQLVAAGLADALEAYPRELAETSELKACCTAKPGHEPPHDVLDPFDEVKR
jgi:hypothetical protein